LEDKLRKYSVITYSICVTPIK